MGREESGSKNHELGIKLNPQPLKRLGVLDLAVNTDCRQLFCAEGGS